MSTLGDVLTVVISGAVLMMTITMVVLVEPPEESVAVAVHVRVSPGETNVGDKTRLASVPKVSPDSLVQA